MSKKMKAVLGSAFVTFMLTACGGAKLPPMDEAEANAIKENIQIVVDGNNKVYGNIRLPEEVDGATITWKADKKKVISTKADGQLKAGVVTRQKEDTDVKLTAAIEKDGKSAKFEQTITVAAAPKAIQDDDYKAYLFGHFVGEAYGYTDNSGKKIATGEQMFFALADVGQGLKFKDLNSSTMSELKPVLSSTVGERGVRDPFIIRSPEGDSFYLIATDLSVYTRGGWNNNNGETKFTINGSHSITLWESHDLVNWTEGRLIEVACPNAGMAWAPEMIYSEETGEYVIFFSSTLIARDDNNKPYIEYRDCIYYTTTRDFHHFTETKKFINNQPYPNGQTDPQKQQDSPKALNNNERKIIDASVMKIGDYYYSAAKDGDNHENNGGILIQKTQDLFDPDSWEKVMYLADINIQAEGRKADNKCLEGPEWFFYNKADRKDEDTPEIGLMADFYANTGVGYIPYATTDIEDTTNAYGSWRGLKSGTDYSWDKQTKRHGTILRITEEEATRLKNTYK